MGISFAKNKVSQLVNDSNVPVTSLTVGVGWDNSSGGKKGLFGKIAKMKGVDLDLACLVYDENGAGVRICGFDSKTLYGGALVHTGDNRTGKGDGIDETIRVDLNRIQENVRSLVFTLNAFKDGVSFAQIAGADCFVIDSSTNPETQLGMFSVPIDDRTKSTVVMAKVVRAGAGEPWNLTVVNEMSSNSSDPQSQLRLGKQHAVA